MKQRLSGRNIIITGASSGIGAATAIACAAAGMDVVLNARRPDRLEDIARSVHELGRQAICIVGDVTDRGISERMLDAAMSEFRGVDAVFANAGYGTSKSVVDHSLDDVRRMFDVNFFASVELLRHAADRLIASKRPGHLLMCSSCLARFSLPDHGAYAATKAAQHSMCSAMRHELKSHAIYVSSVHPITTTTEFFDVSAEMSGLKSEGPPAHTPNFLVQSPERVAQAIVKCLNSPHPEVWTSLLVRGTAALMTLSPRFYDLAIGRATKAEMESRRPER